VLAGEHELIDRAGTTVLVQAVATPSAVGAASTNGSSRPWTRSSRRSESSASTLVTDVA